MAILEQSWSAAVKAAGCPSVLNIDGAPKTIVGTSEGDVVALDGTGKEIWRTAVSVDGADVATWPTIDDVPGLGLCILVGTGDNTICCLSPEGQIIWTTKLYGGFNAFNNISVVRGSNDIALVATDRNGIVTGLTADGRRVWEFSTHGESKWGRKGSGPAAVGDLDGDSVDEIAFCAADGFVYCLSADGSLRWSIYVGDASEYSAVIFAELADGPCAIVGGTDDCLHCISPEGKLLWTQRGTGAGYIESGISIGDINNDGAEEIVFVHQGRALQVADSKGDMLWDTCDYYGGDQPFGPSIADVNGDGVPELLLAQRRGAETRVISNTGELLETITIPGGMVGAPVVADVDGDGKLEVLTVSMNGGELVCYNTEGAADAAPWPTNRGDFTGRFNRLKTVENPTPRQTETASLAAPANIDMKPANLGTNNITVEAAEGAVAEVTLTCPDGITRRTVVGDRQRAAAELELLVTGDYTVSVQTICAESWARGGAIEESVSIIPFSQENAEAQMLLGSLDALAGSNDDIVGITRLLRLQWNDFMSRGADYASLNTDSQRSLITEAGTLLAALRRETVCQTVRQSVMAETEKPVDFLAWQTEAPWTPFSPEADTPGYLLKDVTIRTDQRGHEAFVIQLAAVLDSGLGVRAWFDPITDENGKTRSVADHLELRQVTWVPTPSGGMAADALPDLGSAGVLHIEKSSGARLWVDVSTKDLPAGTYTTTLHLRALTQTGTVVEVPVTWKVEDIALPEVMPVHFCNWGYGFARHFAHAYDEALEDMQDHYTSVFPSVPFPQAKYDADGNIVDEGSWETFDHFISRMRPQNVLLLGAYPLAPEEGAGGPFSDAWKKAFATLLPKWTKHLSDKGVGYDRWAFYPVDEPGLNGGILIVRLEEYARFVKGLDPKVQIYTDPYRGMTVANHKRILDVLDIVQPALYCVVLDENTDRIDFIRSTNQTHWIYEAQAAVKDMVRPRYYWEEIWTAWELGFTGVGYWTYCTTGFDLWEAECDYVLVYQGRTPVPSTRWQAVRIGIEDYARMFRLRQTIDAAREADRTAEADTAEQRLTDLVTEAKAALWDPALIARLRQEVLDMTLKLQSA